MRKPNQRHDRGGHDRWLVSYADLVTLLLAFFTVMYAASSVDATKLAPLSSSLQDAFKAAPTAPAAAPGPPAIAPPIEVVPRRDAIDELRRRLGVELADAIAERRVEVTEDRRGLVVSLPEEAAFPVASDDVSQAALELIGRVAAVARQLPNDIRIEGHTDDVPIRTARFSSNWELSTARASAVVAFLIEDAGIEPSRLSAAGYGEFHPRVPNDSPASRALNRRIDIVVIDPSPEAPHGASGFSRTLSTR